MNHTCEKCHFTTKYKNSFERHKQSRKHLRNVTHIAKTFNCDCCGYSTDYKSNYTRHCNSQRHKNNMINTNIQIVPIEKPTAEPPRYSLRGRKIYSTTQIKTKIKKELLNFVCEDVTNHVIMKYLFKKQ